MYLAISASKRVDLTSFQSVAKVIIPTIMHACKTFEPVASAPIKHTSSFQDFVSENLTGFFKGETVQIDEAILEKWSADFKTAITEVDIETSKGQTARCKVKAIKETECKGKNLIRIPEKIYRILDVEKGEPVKVRPVTNGEKEYDF
jgi:hypothetical protein